MKPQGKRKTVKKELRLRDMKRVLTKALESEGTQSQRK